MRTLRTAAVMLVLLGLAPAARAAEPPALAKARTLYNAGNYEGAIDAAAVARRQPTWADAAALVMARSYIERFRQNADAKDLVAAREAFVSIKSSSLTPRDQVDLLIGLGQSLYLSEIFGSAANLFSTALARSMLLGPRDKQMLLDWWATAMDREAQTRPADRRRVVFEQIQRPDGRGASPGSRQRRGELLAGRSPCGGWETSTAPGRPPSPAGFARRCRPRRPASFAPTSTVW